MSKRLPKQWLEWVKQGTNAWNRFFFEPCDPTAIALYRILLSVLVLIKLAMFWPDRLLWFGEQGLFPSATLRQMHPGITINVLNLLPHTDVAVLAFFVLFLAATICLLVGLFTRFSSILVYLGLTTLAHRNPYILIGGDTVMRVTSFFLMFSACGKALSADRLWRIRQGKESGPPPLYEPWAQRMIQIQISLGYLAATCWKIRGYAWIHGTAAGITHQLLAFQRFPVPYLFNHSWTVHLVTWGTLMMEFSLGVLIWVKPPYRYYILVAGVLFHLGLEYSMTIPLFQWAMIATYVCFIDFPERQVELR